MRFPVVATEKLRAFLSEAKPELVTTAQAVELVRQFTELEHLAAAGRVLFSDRAAESTTWASEGHRSAASWLAEVQKTSLGEACSALDTSRRLKDLERTTNALKAGQISAAQANEIAAAAERDPSSEKNLIETASTTTMKGLKDRARQIMTRSSSEADELARYNAIRASRFARHYTDYDGAFRLDTRLAPDDGARVASAVEAETNLIFEKNRKEGKKDPVAAYRADALVALITRGAGSSANGITTQLGKSQARPAGRGNRSDTLVVRVDAEALRRGYTKGAEVCEIPGVGRVPVATAERMLPESFVKVVISDSVDVLSVCHIGRTVPTYVQTALEERDLTCVVPGCDLALGLENHHWAVDYAKCKRTSLDVLARVCKGHHDLMSYEGFKLTGGPGKWKLVPPPDPAILDTG